MLLCLSLLKHFGFNVPFINWVKTLFTGLQTCVINDGWIKKKIHNSRQIRLGCPSSSRLFVVSVEIMAFSLREIISRGL